MGNCTRFFSNAFEEFGLTEIYALITTPSEDHYGFRIYKNNDCTGNPFGFRVEIPSMEVRVCKKLELPFVGNQADFTFRRQCADCDKLEDLRGKYGDTYGEDEPASSTTSSSPSTTSVQYYTLLATYNVTMELSSFQAAQGR